VAACGAVAAVDARRDAVAAARDEVAVDRAAVPSQGRRGPAHPENAGMNGRRLDFGRFGFGLFTLAMVAAFVGLGLWQLQRRVEKHALIAALDQRLAAAPVPLSPAPAWSTLTPDHDEFRRVSFTATYETRLDAMVYGSGSAIRPDVSGPGTWAFI